VGVRVCVCLGLYAILVFPRFFMGCEVCSGWVTLPPVFDWLQGFMCVCAQVSCPVVSS
jgi:hypothetical protein